MIGYKMGSSRVGVHTIAKTFPVEIFNHGWKNDMVANMATLSAKGVSWRSSILGNLKTSYVELGLPENSNLRQY